MCEKNVYIIFLCGWLIFTNYCFHQEPNSEKTNNGIHYKLQLLYSNGEFCIQYIAKQRKIQQK